MYGANYPPGYYPTNSSTDKTDPPPATSYPPSTGSHQQTPYVQSNFPLLPPFQSNSGPTNGIDAYSNSSAPPTNIGQSFAPTSQYQPSQIQQTAPNQYYIQQDQTKFLPPPPPLQPNSASQSASHTVPSTSPFTSNTPPIANGPGSYADHHHQQQQHQNYPNYPDQKSVQRQVDLNSNHFAQHQHFSDTPNPEVNHQSATHFTGQSNTPFNSTNNTYDQNRVLSPPQPVSTFHSASPTAPVSSKPMPPMPPTPVQSSPPSSFRQQSNLDQQPTRPCPPPAPPMQQPPRSYRSGADAYSQQQSRSFFRQPGKLCSWLEWSQVTSPISLLHDKQLLPSDTADLPIEPITCYPVNCDPDVIRSTLNNVPGSSGLLSRCRLPLGLVMHPFRDLSTLQTITSSVIVRCRSCRTYINPFVAFTDSGRRWRCNVCFLSNTVPDDFFYDPATQTYGDPSRRPEIRSSTVEFIAPAEYMVRPPQPATYLFALDVSHNALVTGYLPLACKRLASLLRKLPGDGRRQVVFITYNSSVHLYKWTGNAMRMLICPDLDEPFIPEYEGLINRIDESVDGIADFLLKLPTVFAGTHDVGNCLGSALQVALKLIGGIGGRITVFNTCLPSTGAGCLSIREQEAVTGQGGVSAKILGPASDFYKTFALDCVGLQVAVDIFSFNSRYSDMATLSGACRFSSGTMYHYPGFYCPSSSNDLDNSSTTDDTKAQESAVMVECFKRDFDRYITRKIGFEAVMRIRSTHGLSVQAFHGSFYVRSVDLVALPNVNPDAGFTVQLGIDESLEKYNTVCLQTAILYTSAMGDRRIRVHTICLPVVHSPLEVFQGADQGAIACLIAKMGVDRALKSGLGNARESLVNAVSDMLTAFGSTSTTTGSDQASLLACPPNLRLLALYVCGLLSYRAFRLDKPVGLDERSSALELVKVAPCDHLLALIYPRLYPIDRLLTEPLISSNTSLLQQAASLSLYDTSSSSCSSLDSSSPESRGVHADACYLPGQLHLTAGSLSSTGVFLLDTGEFLFLLVGAGSDYNQTDGKSKVLNQLLGISSPLELPQSGGPFGLAHLLVGGYNGDSAGKRRLISLIRLLQSRRPMGSTLVWLRNDAPAGLRSRFISALVEDKSDSSLSYHELLLSIQSLIKSS